MPWSSLNLPTVPGAINSAVSTVGDVSSTLADISTVLKTAVDVLASLPLDLPLTPTQIALQAAVSAIQASINSFLNNTGIYVLFVPPSKKLVVPSIVEAAFDRVGGTAPVDRNGGNTGFVNKVVASLIDQGDLSRPQLLDSDAVAGITILTGSDEFNKIGGFLNTFSALIGGKINKSALQVPGIPTPQNLKVTIGPKGPVLTWTSQAWIFETPALGELGQIDKIAIIRGTKPTLLNLGNLDSNLAIGQTFENGSITVAAIIDNNTNTWLDTSVVPSEGPYYYALSYNQKDVGFGSISNTVKAGVSVIPSASGTPPDWSHYGSVASIFPGLQGLLESLSAYTNTIGGYATGVTTTLSAFANLLEKQALSFEAYANKQLALVDKLNSLLTTTFEAGVYIRPFSGVGGNSFIKSDLSAAFNEESAPPFTTGQEFVSGVVLLVAGPTAGEILPAYTLLKTLFGVGD